MSTQYDNIQGPYDACRECSIAMIERENVETTVAPYIKNARVLELACGSGFYTYHFLKWGARSVTGVDISPVMIEEAKRRAPSDMMTGTVDFKLADCSKVTSYEEEPFDIVFGAWLLNYAPDRAALVDMFRNIAINLKGGGRFVGITVPPTQDPAGSIEAEYKLRPPPEGSGFLVGYVAKDVEEGVYFHMHGDTKAGAVDFDCYHLRKDVYESAAREAGLRGKLEWGITSVPERYLRGEGPGGSSLRELESYQKVPNYGILTVAK